MKSRSWMIAVLWMLVAVTSARAEDAVSNQKVKYTEGKDVNFEELLIQGQLKRPDVSVVTGNVKEGADGLLRLRENFLDRVTSDAGEESME
jgi:hypothetical protein